MFSLVGEKPDRIILQGGRFFAAEVNGQFLIGGREAGAAAGGGGGGGAGREAIQQEILDYIIREDLVGELLNVILVIHDIRPAMLLQKADYFPNPQEKMDHIVTLFKALFKYPLIYTQKGIGVFISKNELPPGNTDKVYGEILGYPCADDYEYIIKNSASLRTYAIGVWVKLTNGKELQLFVNVCLDKTPLARTQAQAEAASLVLAEHGFNLVERAYVNVDTTIPPNEILQKLTTEEILDEYERAEISNYLYNMDIDLEAADFDFDNKIHRGILIAFSAQHIIDPYSPFYPFEGRAYQEFLDKSKELTALLRRLLDATRIV